MSVIGRMRRPAPPGCAHPEFSPPQCSPEPTDPRNQGRSMSHSATTSDRRWDRSGGIRAYYNAASDLKEVERENEPDHRRLAFPLHCLRGATDVSERLRSLEASLKSVRWGDDHCGAPQLSYPAPLHVSLRSRRSGRTRSLRRRGILEWSVGILYAGLAW